MCGEDFWKTQYALCIAPWANAVADRPDLRLFQGLDAVRGVRTGPQRTKNQLNPVPFLSELREIERPAATTVFAIQRPLQEIFNNRQMLVKSSRIQFLSAACTSKATRSLGSEAFVPRSADRRDRSLRPLASTGTPSPKLEGWLPEWMTEPCIVGTAWPSAEQHALESNSPHRPGTEGALRYREQCEEPKMSS